MQKTCKNCKQTFRPYTTVQSLCPKCAAKKYFNKPRKPINKRGKRTIEYEKWRDKVAKPYLDKTYGHKCSRIGCFETEYLEVDHVKTRGSRADLKMELSNVRFLCRLHHSERK